MTEQLTFYPSSLIIQVGDTVRWLNVSTGNHTATADSFYARRRGFNSGFNPQNWLVPGETFEFTFTLPGEYPYHCIPHQLFGMLGTIIVRPATSLSAQFFTATASENGVALRWKVGGRANRLGFNVLRSTGWNQEFTQVNEAVISVEGNPLDEAEYIFVDGNVVPGTRYYYVLEDVTVERGASYRGPAIAVPR